MGTLRHRHDRGVEGGGEGRGGEGTVGVPPPCRQGRCLNLDEEEGKDDRKWGRGDES